MNTYGIYFILNDGMVKLVKLQALNKQEAIEAALIDNDVDDLGVNEIQIRLL
ncbi:hypothetical protein [Sporosarcina globispora]|uniref:hypothetical protein n=1 Tax=Sporosarcina globispora TaxID=1459 RepID=UPI000AFE9197|nr:hypothetical protein [Sporosarcina globispora]